MDLQRLMYGRIAFGTEQISLGRGTISAMLIRAATAIKSIPVTVKHLAIEFNFNEFSNESPLFGGMRLEAELEAGIIPADQIAEDWKPGITYAMMAEAMESAEYKRYALLCEPDKRIGVSEEFISAARNDYEFEFPDISRYIPVWRDS